MTNEQITTPEKCFVHRQPYTRYLGEFDWQCLECRKIEQKNLFATYAIEKLLGKKP